MSLAAAPSRPIACKAKPCAGRASGCPWRLEAIRRFTLGVLSAAGAVDDDTLKALLVHGYTERNALEVVLGVGTYTMSTFANRLVRAV